MLITLVPCERILWEDFKQYHYMTTPLNKASRTFLALAGGVPVGFCASLPMPSGTLKNAYRAHKTVVRMPESPTMFKLWALVADAQAKLHVAEGKRFFSAAPMAYAAYRDNPESIWVPTSTDRQQQAKKGLRSHESQAPQSGWVPTSKDKRRRESGFCSHEYVAAENCPVEFEGIRRETNKTYSAHPLPKIHFRGANPGGPRECWAYHIGGEIVGWAVMKRIKDGMFLRRIVVQPALDKDKYIAVGQALVKAMCENYPAWKSLSDAEKEAPHYHDFYKVDGVVKGPETEKKIPKSLHNIPISLEDWSSRDGCAEFLKAHPEWHKRIIENAKELGHSIAPGGKIPTLPQLQKMLADTKHASLVLKNACPATQITYVYQRKEGESGIRKSEEKPPIWVPETDSNLIGIAQDLRNALIRGALRPDCPDDEMVRTLRTIGGCTITPKNVSDTRCISMAMHRLNYCAQKARMLTQAIGSPELPQETRQAAQKALDVYREAFQAMAKFATDGAAVVECHQAAIVPADS